MYALSVHQPVLRCGSFQLEEGLEDESSRRGGQKCGQRNETHGNRSGVFWYIDVVLVMEERYCALCAL